MLGIILSCYKEFSSRLTVSETLGRRSTSLDIVRAFAFNTIGTFSKQDAMFACPRLGSSSVESALKKLVADGTLTRIGAGRQTRYVRSDALTE